MSNKPLNQYKCVFCGVQFNRQTDGTNCNDPRNLFGKIHGHRWE